MQIYGTEYSDYAMDMVLDTDSTLLFCGYRDDSVGMIIRTRLNGDTVYMREYPDMRLVGLMAWEGGRAIGVDMLNGRIAVDPNNGAILWQQPPDYNSTFIIIEACCKVGDAEFAMAGHVNILDTVVYIPGYGWDSVYQAELYVARYDTAGVLKDADTLPMGADYDNIHGITYRDGFYHITGSYSNPGWPDQLFILRMDTTGSLIHPDFYQNNGIYYGKAIAVDSLWNAYITGGQWMGTTTGYVTFVAKYAPNGTLIWQREFNHVDASTTPEGGQDIFLHENGSITALGSLRLPNNAAAIGLHRMDGSGNVLLDSILPLTGNNHPAKLLELGPNDLAISGWTNEDLYGEYDWFYIRCDTLSHFTVGLEDPRREVPSVEGRLAVHPCPAVEAFTYTWEGKGKLELVEVVDMQGRVIFAEQVAAKSGVLANGKGVQKELGLPAGMYVLRGRLADGSVVYGRVVMQ